MLCLIHADAGDIIVVSADDHLVDLAAAVSDVLDAVARALLWMALRPLPGVLSDTWTAATAILALAGLTVAGGVAGSRWLAAVCLLLGIVVLLTIAGVRLEVERVHRERVQIDLTPLPPLQLGESNGLFVQYSIRITNNGPSGTFTARVNSDVTGWSNPSYGHFYLPWEGSNEEETQVRRSTTTDVHVARLYVMQSLFRFLLPSRSGKTWELGEGVSMQATRDLRLEFEFRVWDDERENGASRRAVIEYPHRRSGEPWPTLPDLRLEST